MGTGETSCDLPDQLEVAHQPHLVVLARVQLVALDPLLDVGPEDAEALLLPALGPALREGGRDAMLKKVART